MYRKLTKSLIFSPKALVRVVPTLLLFLERNTRGFSSLGSFEKSWLSILLNSLVNKRAMLTFGFYSQKLNCLTVLSEKPLIQDVKEHVSERDSLLYNVV